VLTGIKTFRAVVFAVTLAGVGCHAQVPAGGKLSPEVARRIEVQIRSKSNIPPNYDLVFSPLTKSEIEGYDEVSITFVSEAKSSKPVLFLVSKDGKTLAQFSKYDISKDPKSLVSDAGRPARGGPATAPVVIVGFDDLECPYCARMHAALFPGLMERYKDQVRIVYKDFPLSIHPWAMRAAIDTNCVAAQSGPAYWNLVDYIHNHAGELGGEQKSLAKANEQLDTLTKDEAKRQKLNLDAVDACIAKQDDSSIQASTKVAEGLGVESTPVLFINGEKLEGAVPVEYIYKMIDSALTALGQKPPAPFVPAAGAPVPAAQVPQSNKPGN